MEGKVGCLLIHGIAGSVKEVSPMADCLMAKGHTVICVELKGHNGVWIDLARSTYIDWIKSAEEALIDLQQKCDKVVIVGFSMGGLISANLLTKYNVDAVVLLNTPVYFWDFKMMGRNLLTDMKAKSSKSIKRYFKASTDKPFRTLINFLILLNKTKGMFKNIKCPVFIGQGMKDDTVQYRSANYIYKQISAHKELKFYENSGHVIFFDSEKEQVILDVEEYVNTVL